MPVIVLLFMHSFLNVISDTSNVGFQKQNTVFATGKSIFDRSSKTNVGELMLKYGGGGHQAAGTCQIEHDKSDEILKELISQITKDG